jgi:hypothetical protein
MIPLIIKATITAPPAKFIAGPMRIKMAPAIIAAIPTMIMSSRPRERTS